MNRSLLLALALAALGALVLAACGSSDSNVGSTVIQESPAEAVESQGGEEIAGSQREEESTGEGAEEGTGEGAGTAEEEPEEGSKGAIVPSEGETEEPEEGSKGAIVPSEGETEEPESGQEPGGAEGEEPAAGEATGEGGAAALTAGKSAFEANCGSCHTLADAGTTGEVGPNLDELMPEMALVETQVTNGGAGMPAFQGVLSEEEIDAVAAYVSTVAGKG